jgi:hypothetical protein
MRSLTICGELTARVVDIFTDHSFASLGILFLCLNTTDALPTVTAGIASVGILTRLIRLLPRAQEVWWQVTQLARPIRMPESRPGEARPASAARVQARTSPDSGPLRGPVDRVASLGRA